jgi:hypothetical protein
MLRLGAVVALLGFAFATPALACLYDCYWSGPGLPNYSLSTIPSVIRVVGYGADGSLDPAGEFTVVVRGISGNTLPLTQVTLDFAGAAPGQICDVAIPQCHTFLESEQRVTAVAGSGGIARFRIAGCAMNPGDGTGPSGGLVSVYICGVLVKQVPAVFVDQAGQDGADANDLSAWLGDFGSSNYFSRSDYDGNGILGANDLSLWLGLQGAGGSALGCANHP